MSEIARLALVYYKNDEIVNVRHLADSPRTITLAIENEYGVIQLYDVHSNRLDEGSAQNVIHGLVRRYPEPNYIYLMEMRVLPYHGARYKIGFSKDPRSRAERLRGSIIHGL